MTEEKQTVFEKIKPQNKELTSIISQILNVLTHIKIYPVGESNLIVETLKNPRTDYIPIEEIVYYALGEMKLSRKLLNKLHEWADECEQQGYDYVKLSS
ncbi:MAG: hypothetical protein GF383_03395 [Candidatus Lokiarchaeota archaeon]|nr:hypothetical protein [Candidatus Lokiarchaeota archaeon]